MIVVILIIIIVGVVIGLRIQNSKDNNSDKKKLFINKRYLLGIGVVVIFLLLGLLIKMYNNQDSSQSDNPSALEVMSLDNEQKQNKVKEYYDFIDKENMTFYFTEDEFMNRVTKGTSYSTYGYEKSKSTSANTNNYSKVTMNDIQTIAITTNPSNNKVSRIQMMVLGTNYTEQQMINIKQNMYINLITWIVNKDATAEENVQMYKDLIQELGDDSSTNKGLKRTVNDELVGNSGKSTTIVIEVVE